jgi:hypothetical protein
MSSLVRLVFYKEIPCRFLELFVWYLPLWYSTPNFCLSLPNSERFLNSLKLFEVLLLVQQARSYLEAEYLAIRGSPHLFPFLAKHYLFSSV